MALGYLLDPFIQVNTIVGTPVVGAKIYVYNANTTNLAITYRDFQGHLNTNPVRTDTLGNCTIIADDVRTYDIEVRDALGLLLMSKKNVSIAGTSGESSDVAVEAGYGVSVSRVNNIFTVSVDTTLIATKDDLTTKQDKMRAGDNIEITQQNQINVVNRRELLAEYPIKMDRGADKLKLYIDEEYLDNIGSNSLVAGPDIAIDDLDDAKVIGIDTNSTATGDYNFYAGNANTISGDNNAAFGYNNEIDGSYNAIFGASNNIEGDRNLVFGQRNIANSHSYSNLVGGTDITANQCSYNLFGGSQNSAYMCAGSNLIGYDNVLQQDNYTYVGGNSNNLTFFNNSICVGNNNLFNATQGASHAAIIGRYNTISGTGYGNDMIFGSQNIIDGSNDFVVGNNNTVSGDNKYIVGNNNIASGTDYMYMVGHATSGIEGGIVLGVEGHNNFEIRKNDDIYYRYNGTMMQLKPLGFTANGFDRKYSKTVTIDSNTTAGFSVMFDNIDDYKTWVSTGLITSPCICRVVVYSDHRTSNAAVALYCNRIYTGGGSNAIFDSWILRFTDLPTGGTTSTYMSWLEGGNYTFPCSNDAFTAYYGDWNPRIQINATNNTPFAIGDKVTVEIEFHAIKLI